MSGGQILLVILAVIIPLAIAVAVTLWTLQPAVRRAERARRAQRTRSARESGPVDNTQNTPAPE